MPRKGLQATLRIGAVLARDLRRWLDGEATEARPLTLLQKTARWARRRPTSAALVSLLTLTILAGTIGIIWHSRQLASRAFAG